MVRTLDVCIRGGGIVGRTLALLLAREPLRVGLVERTTANPTADVRAYALNRASRELLLGVRAWPEAPAAATAVRRMCIQADRGSTLHFDAAELGAEALTWIVDVPALEARLAEAVRYQPRIELLTEAAPAHLTVVCEGRASRTRAEFGVDFEVLPYGQHALAARVQTQHPHRQVAYQWFDRGEILALLPLDGPEGHTVGVVWSVAPQRAEQLRTMDPAAFAQALQQASAGTLGQLQLVSERQSWPLQKAMARQWVGRHPGGAWALAGDAAHNVHPLAGQGLNLGLADVAELSRVLHGRDYWRAVDDLRLLRRYERARKADMLALDAGMDGLQLLFTREGPGWGALRSLGLQCVERASWLKPWLARHAMG
jgi:2-polyprenyl-6-methoxyphenol hydroxylase-like FAD-dependent oxidoreductase